MGFRPLTPWCLSLLVAPIAPLLGASERQTWQDPYSGIEFIKLPSGCYPMGNPYALDEEVHNRLRQFGFTWPRFADETPVHQICVGPFWMGRYEVTTQQWATVMSGSITEDNARLPVANISWQQAMHFIERLNRDSGRRFRLPTEAEWEYACRTGQSELPDYTLNPDRREKAWYSHRGHRPTPQPVGQLTSNNWGLYDMLGNVWEWTQDSYSVTAYQDHAYNNPLVQTAATSKVIRGGSHRSEHRHIRCTARDDHPATGALPQLGLRLVMESTP